MRDQRPTIKRDRNEAIGAILLIVLLLSGCSVLDNSERYYKNRPYQPINYRVYTTD
jgi:PBP1b-binding outer membrane lipoprotein LpoB